MKKIFLFGLLIFLGFLTWRVTTKQPDLKNKLQITFFDIGQGDATLISFPNGEQMLIDCAKDARVLSALGRALFFSDRTIDYLVVTHPDLDHYGGCTDVLDRFSILNLVTNGVESNLSLQWQAFLEAVNLEQANKVWIKKETEWKFGSTTIHFIYPNKDLPKGVSDNNSSIAFIVSLGEKDVLFLGDVEAEVEKYLIGEYPAELDVEVLKVAHHGSKNSTLSEFLNVVTPEQAIISVGAENSYGHPHARVLRRLQRIGAQIWRTDISGDILLEMDEENIRIKSQF